MRLGGEHDGSKLRGTEEPQYFTTKVGSYDMWAIEYGYMEVEGEELLEEHAVRFDRQRYRGRFPGRRRGGGGARRVEDRSACDTAYS